MTASTAGTPPATAAPVFEQVTEYRVSAGPLDDREGRRHSLIVSWSAAKPGTWTVTDGADWIGPDGRWDWEWFPNERPEDWRDGFRYDLDTALGLAREAAPKVVVNGRTWAQWQERHAARRLLGEEEDSNG